MPFHKVSFGFVRHSFPIQESERICLNLDHIYVVVGISHLDILFASEANVKEVQQGKKKKKKKPENHLHKPS